MCIRQQAGLWLVGHWLADEWITRAVYTSRTAAALHCALLTGGTAREV